MASCIRGLKGGVGPDMAVRLSPRSVKPVYIFSMHFETAIHLEDMVLTVKIAALCHG